MELEDLKNTWKKEKVELENRVTLNEKYIHDLIIEKSKGRFTHLLGISVLGRYLALVYMGISVWFAYSVKEELAYSIPAFMGAAAMLFSFFQHRGLKLSDSNTMNTIALQKSISQFRIHTAKYGKYDIAIVAIWMITLAPVYLKRFFHLSIYNDPAIYIPFFAIILVITALLIMFSGKIYQKWNTELATSEINLNKIKAFEES